ncbi:MFS transporter [Desulfovibrio psychrotolerans]|uniref:MFS transporter n=1 Tax=Desulfovibrio psychrotolerans TaxID=415242 RepID=A0A7J0BQT4_9BACT|nr:MFS transporter [Desulfovibrio psychrotolerans]GFM36018.1 MFS transporter [Desulfovibrio psychrotolerans]
MSHPSAIDADNRRMFIFLLVLVLAVAAAFQGWRTLYNNFAVELAGLTGEQNGLVQSLREVPGFLSLLVIYIMLVVREHTLVALSVLTLGVGVAITGFFPSFHGVIFTTLIMSFGFHYYETVHQSLVLQYFNKAQAPAVMGRMRGFSSGANIAVGIAIFLLSPVLEYHTLFLLFGCVAVLAALWCFTQNPVSRHTVPQRRGMVLRRRYWLFYLLTFFSGARRQIFVAFAVFLMVQRFGFSVQEITALFILNNAVNWFLSPAIGRAVTRFGERRMLTLEYAALIAVFVGYAVVQSKLLVAALYILDHVFYNFAMAIKTYFQKIADPADIAPSMAVSFTINHIAAVFIPAVGGMLWMVDYRIPFLGAAGLACVSLVLSQFIRTPAPEEDR